MANNFDKLDKMTDGPTAYFTAGSNGQNNQVKQENFPPTTLIEPPHRKQGKLVFSLLEQYCDFIICENEEDYLFYSKEQFNIFAKDKGGGVYGFIGGIGNIEDMPDFCEIQQSIADNLGIKRQEGSIESLFICLSEEPKFIVYSRDDNNPSESLLMWRWYKYR